MFRTDTGNFNRFLTSIGLLLLAAALLIPYFYFRDPEVLRTSRAELRALTPVARDALDRRQHRSADLEIPVLVFSILLAGGGAAAIFFGGKRLRVAQRKEDEAIERKARREDYEFQQMSVVEVEVRRDELAREAVRESQAVESESDAEGDEGLTVPKAKDRQAPAPAVPKRTRPRNPADVRYQEMRREIARIEEKVKRVLEQMQLDRFDYFSELEIVQAGGRRRLSVDGLFQAQAPNQPDIALGLSVSRFPQRRSSIDTDQLLARIARYRDLTGRDALGWLLLIIPKDDAETKEPDWAELEKKYEDLLAGLGRCSIVREQDLDKLPSRFSAVFGS